MFFARLIFSTYSLLDLSRPTGIQEFKSLWRNLSDAGKSAGRYPNM